MMAYLPLVIIAPRIVNANELMLFYGSMNHSAIGGCCRSTGSQNGFGVIGRIDFSNVLGTLDFLSYSDGRWTEGVVLRPIEIVGSTSRSDSFLGESINTKIVSDFRYVLSLGLGAFSYTGRTKTFDLPIRISGLQASSVNQIYYNLNKDLALIALLNIGYAVSAADQSLLLGFHLGASYDF